MSEFLKWDVEGTREYETGVDHGILFKKKDDGSYENGSVWNGLTSVDESPSGAEANDIYADNMKYLSLTSAEDFGGSINAYSYPDEFAECNGEKVVSGIKLGQQTRKPFGFYYRTIKGNDVLYDEYGHIHHFVYNAKCTPSDSSYSTVSDSPEAIEMSWEYTTTPVKLVSKDANGKDLKATAIVKIDDTDASIATALGKFKLNNLLALVYGSDSADTAGYIPTADTTKSQEKTYYEITATKSGDDIVYSFSEVSGSFVEGTTYFEKAAADTSGNYPSILPTPDQIITLFAVEVEDPS